MESEHLSGVVATNVNEEAVILRGCTTSELIGASIACTTIIIPLFLIVGLIMGKMMICMAVGFAANFGAIFGTATLMQKMKRGRPDGYFNHWMMLIGKKIGMVKAPFVIQHGSMSIFRKKQIILLNKHLKQTLDR